MYKAKQSTVFVVIFSGALCLAFLVSACAPDTPNAPESAEVQKVSVDASMPAPSLGLVVDKEKRVIDVLSDSFEHLGKDMGIQVGDVVLAINEMPVVLEREAILELQKSLYSPSNNEDSEVSVRVLRDGKELVLTTTLDQYYASIEAEYERLAEAQAEFEGKTKAEVDAIIEEAGAPIAPESLPPTPTPIPEDLYFL